MKRKLTAALVLLAVALVFTIQNQRAVRVQFLFWWFETPVSVLFFGLFILGLAFGMLVTWLGGRRQRR